MNQSSPKRNIRIEPDSTTNERDELRMRRSGAAESGYHEPTPDDIEDIKKDHSTTSAPGTLNVDEGIRRDAAAIPEFIDPVSGRIEEQNEREGEERTA